MKKIILILSVFMVITNCKNDDDNNIQQNNDTEPDHEIVAKWKLTEFVQFGPSYDYNGEILWTFDSNETVNVVIVDGTDLSANLPLNTSGIYSYSFVQSNDSGILLDNQPFIFKIINNELILLANGGPSNDGEQLTFELVE